MLSLVACQRHGMAIQLHRTWHGWQRWCKGTYGRVIISRFGSDTQVLAHPASGPCPWPQYILSEWSGLGVRQVSIHRYHHSDSTIARRTLPAVVLVRSCPPRARSTATSPDSTRHHQGGSRHFWRIAVPSWSWWVTVPALECL